MANSSIPRDPYYPEYPSYSEVRSYIEQGERMRAEMLRGAMGRTGHWFAGLFRRPARVHVAAR